MGILEILKAILFGVVEGITEWLPISSTGHMILLNEFVKLQVSEDFWSMFLVVIQLGAILAVLVLFWHRLWPFTSKEKYFIKKDTFTMWFKIAVACIPAVVIGLPFEEQIEALFYNYQTVAAMLILFGVLFIVIEKRNAGKPAKIHAISAITYQTAFAVGLFQLIAAIFPGTSRSGATILGGIMVGMSRTAAAEFTFFLAVPVMAGAGLLKLLKFGFSYSSAELIILLIGLVTAFAVSVIVIRFLLNYIRKHDFKVFGWYRIVLGILVLLYFTLR